MCHRRRDETTHVETVSSDININCKDVEGKRAPRGEEEANGKSTDVPETGQPQ